MKIDICLAVLNNIDYTKKFIDSLYRSTYHDFELIITDNGSKDGTSEWLSSLGYDNLKVISYQKNTGCATGWNSAIKGGVNKHVVLTQNDIQFSKNWDKPLVDFLEANKDHMAAGSIEIENLDLSQEELDRLCLEFKNNIIGYNRFYIPCIMMHRDIFDKVGYFDENFKTGTYEDSDFINRCANADVKFAQVFDSIVCHVFGRTSRKYANVGYNRDYFFKKWKDKEVKNLHLGHNIELKGYLSKLYGGRTGKIDNDIVKEKLKKLNIPIREVK